MGSREYGRRRNESNTDYRGGGQRRVHREAPSRTGGGHGGSVGGGGVTGFGASAYLCTPTCGLLTTAGELNYPLAPAVALVGLVASAQEVAFRTVSGEQGPTSVLVIVQYIGTTTLADIPTGAIP